MIISGVLSWAQFRLLYRMRLVWDEVFWNPENFHLWLGTSQQFGSCSWMMDWVMIKHVTSYGVFSSVEHLNCKRRIRNIICRKMNRQWFHWLELDLNDHIEYKKASIQMKKFLQDNSDDLRCVFDCGAVLTISFISVWSIHIHLMIIHPYHWIPTPFKTLFIINPSRYVYHSTLCNQWSTWSSSICMWCSF